MKILKRNQLIILVISLMLITAGYLNFTNNNLNVQTSTIASRDDATVGDAKLVSTIPISENETENQISNSVPNEIIIENTVTTNNTQEKNKTDDYYFETSKLERNSMYSEILETYQKIYNDTNSLAEQKTEAINKIAEINNIKNAIMISENLIAAKGFKDVVIFVNEASISVIIKIEELKQEQVAQIQNIVSRELNVSAEQIHISNK